MSLSCSECFSDLLCGEDSNIIFSDYEDDSPGYSSELESRLPESEEYMAGLLEDERSLTEINVHQTVDASVRAESVAWILKVYFYFPIPNPSFLGCQFTSTLDYYQIGVAHL